MEIGHLTDLLPYAFSTAANISHTITPPLIEAGQDLWAGLTQSESMASADRALQIIKVAGATLGLCLSMSNTSIEGITACAIADGEALMEIGKHGHQWRMSHAPH